MSVMVHLDVSHPSWPSMQLPSSVN